MPLASV